MENKENIIYFNTKEGFGIDSSLLQDGWQVMNAPRPIPGQIVWQGTFRHGIFYAAGSKEEFGRLWHYLDAYPCKIISNEEIIEMAKTFCLRHKKTLETCGVPITEIAKMMKLPFIAD
jgi:hypothetical protein